MNLAIDFLEDDHVRLERLAPGHAQALRVACEADAEIWPLYPINWTGEAFEASWRSFAALGAEGRTVSFAVLRAGEVVGMTSFLAIDAANRSVEIGATYYRPDARGGVVNPAAKRLMLAHAFTSGAHRITFRVDALNARSRAAVLKLGATQEGIVRQDRLIWTGRIRDTVIFSILSGEWPAVRARLDERLGT
jgi:RimJ/RimL family protein N-acetyltransferase